VIFRADNIAVFKKKALQWAAASDTFCYLDANNFVNQYSRFDVLIAVGARHELTASSGSAFQQLEDFRQLHPGWMTGFMSYDLKNEIEEISSSNIDHLQFPDLYFFVPQHLIVITPASIEIISPEAQLVFNEINQQVLKKENAAPSIVLQPRFSKTEYISAVNSIKQHINRGDIYVTNFCQEFYAEHVAIDPLSIFEALNRVSPNPFSGLFKLQDKYIICASPERFLAKRGSKLISQPIKGTAKRGKGNEDEAIMNTLRNHPKELQENVMIVDLVRNDLTRSAKKGTVKTEELFGIYSFKQVHQMISTVVCEIREDVSAIQAIKNTFPMGSMTGAPKVSSMKLMELYERTKRGVYSGALGYLDPSDDFDFNVVIRSLFYNADNKYLSFQVGSAITLDANAEKEYEECLLKGKAILEVLGQAESSLQS
jgi:para-aminobenzoate synthetase component 1